MKLSITIVLLLCSILSFSQNKANEYNAIGYNYLNVDLDSSSYYCHKALVISMKQGEITEQITANINLGLGNVQRQKFKKSLQYFSTADSLSIALGDKKNEAIAKMQIASTLSMFSEFSFDSSSRLSNRIVNYYNKSFDIFEESKDTFNLIRLYIKRGLHFGRTNSFRSPIRDYTLAYGLAVLYDDSIQIAQVCQNIGSYYYYTENFDSTKYDSTILYSKQSMQYVNPKNKAIITYNLMNIGAAYFQFQTKEMDDSARLYFELANNELKGQNMPQKQFDVWYNLAQWHRYVGDPEKSANYFDKAFDLRTKLISESKNKAFSSAQEQFYTVSIEAESQKTKIKNRNLGLGIAASLLLLLGSFFIIRNTRQQKRLAEQGKGIANQKIDNLLQTQEMKNLDAMLEGQDNERKRIAADLHDRLGSMLSTVKLHFTSMEDKLQDLQKDNQEQYHKATSLLDEATNEVRRISHDLSTGTIAKFGLIPALYELKNTLDSTNKITVNILETGMDERLDMNLEISIYRIIQELIANTLKHAKANKVDIHLTKIEDSLNVIIEDNGIGFDVSKKSDGIGIQNIKQRVAKIDGEITYDSTSSLGTTVILNFEV